MSGKLTFYDGRGYKGYLPDEFDLILDGHFQLPEKFRKATVIL